MSRRRLAILASLGGLSALVVAMIAVRVVYTGNDYYTNLVWNLFLAWIPFGLAVYVYDGYRKGQGRLQLWAAGALWLLFFPNALYIVTDFKWLRDWAGAPIWYDVVLVSAAAWCGLLARVRVALPDAGHRPRRDRARPARGRSRSQHSRSAHSASTWAASSAGTPGTSLRAPATWRSRCCRTSLIRRTTRRPWPRWCSSPRSSR